MAIEVRWAEGSTHRFPQLIAELIGSKFTSCLSARRPVRWRPKMPVSQRRSFLQQSPIPCGYGIIPASLGLAAILRE